MGGVNEIAIIAHRGAPKRFPENTVQAFEQAIQEGATGFECDVNLTEDGHPVIIHTRFNTGSISSLVATDRDLRSLSLREVQGLRLRGSDCHIPHLEEVLSLAQKRGVWCYLEPKSDDLSLVERIAEAVKHNRMVEQSAILTFFSRRHLLRHAKRLNSGLKTAVIVISPIGRFTTHAAAAEADVIVLGWKGVNHFQFVDYIARSLNRRVAEAQRKHLVVMGGYADHFSDITWAIGAGLSGIFTNDVALAKSATEQFKARRAAT